MLALLLLNFIVPFVMLLVSRLLKRKAYPYPGPYGVSLKWKIDGSGYNTPRSRKSKEHWDYAQQIAPDYFIRWGKISLWVAVACVLPVLFVPPYVCVAISTAVGLGCMTEAFVETEKALTDRFGL